MATVLVVDDSLANRELILTVLAHQRHRSLEAADGAEALDIVRRERPDLVICDILMPTMDGYEFVRRLRAYPDVAGTEVVFYTEYYLEQSARNLARACGVTRILVKPCVPEEIIDVIDQALARKAPPDVPAVSDDFNREHLRLMTDKLSEKVGELRAANERLSALTELNLELASARNPHSLLEQFCRGARDLAGAKYAVLCVRDRLNGESQFSTVSGIAAIPGRELARPELENTMFAPVVHERRPLRFTVAGGESSAAGLPPGYPSARAVLACPIASLSNCYGWIGLFDKVGEEIFSEDDERLLSVHASQVGRIYENGSLAALVSRHAEQVQESELRFRELAENINEVFFLVSADSRQTLYISPAYETVWGRSCESLYARARSWLDAVHSEDIEAVLASVRQGGDQSATPVQYRIVRPDGSVRWISSRRFPIRNASGEVYRIAGIADDITERKLAEMRVARLSRIHAVLSDINALIVRVRERDELFHDACRIAVEAGQFRLAWIGLVDRAAEEIRPVAWYGIGEDYIKLMPLKLQAGSTDTFGLASRAVVEGKPIVSDDMSVDTRVVLAQEAARRGLRALAILPLVGAEGVSGVLALYSGETGIFDDEEMKLLLELAGDIAFALDHIAKAEKLDYLAYYDTLTGLANPALFRERLAQHIAIAASERRQFAVALLDIDRFNAVNDSLGRQAGDQLLKRFAERLASDPRRASTIARVGADAFGVLLHDIKQPTDVAHALDEVQAQCVAAPFQIGGNDVKVSVKIGIAVYPGDGGDADTLLRNAEVALRGTKASDEARVFYTQEMSRAITQRIGLENDLRLALQRDEFVLHYQPKVDIESRGIRGVEALLRWRSPERGLVAPLEFIPALEETGMIVAVGAWVMRRARLDYGLWLQQNLAAPRIAVNVSAVQLRRSDFVQLVTDVLRPDGERPGIDIEITESMIMDDAEGTIDKLTTLRGLGVGVAIDDFGTGYSSLAYLGRLPVESLKIDRAFTVKMTDHPDAMTLVSTIISLAHSLGLKVCAEGVETEEQATMLRLLRCDEMQGYLVSRPVPLDDLTRMLPPEAA
jgi:diguanylate cyclase (GGDEF)-like protein/PAS domain S-box-containing protein